MKGRLFVALLFSVAFVLPAFTQQNNSGSATQATAQSSSSQGDTSLEPLPPPKKGDFWDGDEPNVVNLITHPFATKAYVRRQTTPIKDRLNELDQLTTENTAQIKDVDSRARHGIQLASDKANLADEHANDATNRAQMAQTAATQASSRVAGDEQLVANLDQYKAGQQTEIQFHAGQTALSKDAKNALDEMAGGLKDQHSYIIEVQGFAPGHGQTSIRSSQKMADSVVRYLVETHQIPIYRIYMLGMGDASITGQSVPMAGHARSGRVEVSVMKNDLVSSAAH
jgi:outer membrane protein OmpA-like peptidoglycan-associated protein